MKTKLAILFLLIDLTAYSQDCKIGKITTYDDTLTVILNYEIYLFHNPELNLINKLNTLYTDYLFNQRIDTCFLFLIPDSHDEFASDGNFVSHCMHRSTLDKQKDVRWIEVVHLVKVKNFYLFTITTNKLTNGKKMVQKTIHYKVSCKDKNGGYRFRRKLF